MTRPAGPEDLLRTCAPQVLGALLRRYGTGQFDLCENAVQEALLAAHEQWPVDGRPRDPLAWLVAAARRRLIDQMRSDARRRERERTQADLAHPLAHEQTAGVDDSLEVLTLCCHPALGSSAQVALTLRAVAGLTTAQIAHAYLLPEATVAQRISRAKAKIRSTGIRFPAPVSADDRLDPVLRVLYLMFNEGHLATTGDSLYDTDLTTEAIRLARQVHAQVPAHGEAAGLLALMLLTDARRAARTGPGGTMVPLDEQDRSLWNRADIRTGTEILRRSLGGAPGPYALQAAIAALHAEATSVAETDWPQILVLYKLLERSTGNPVVTLNRAVAEAMVHGPEAGLTVVAGLVAGGELPGDHHRLLAVRAHLAERAGRPAEARDYFRQAARRTTSTAERAYLLSKAGKLDQVGSA